MTKTRLFLPLLLVLAFSCSRKPVDFEAALFLFERNELEEALPLFKELAEKDSSDPRVLAYLAETYRRFGRKSLALETARRALALDPCNSFAHTVIAETCNPLYGAWAGAHADTTWQHLLKATECDPRDGNPWLAIWVEAIRRGDRDRVTRAAEMMMETGIFSRALLSYNEWVLASLPPNALLVTNGDMDTYPAVALQVVEEKRGDVIIVNRALLSQTWYARYLRDAVGMPLPFSDSELDKLTAVKGDDGVIETPADDIIEGWIAMWKAGKVRNPIAFGMTVPSEYAARFGEPVRYAGAVQVITTEEHESPDAEALSSGLRNFTAEDFSGPWVSAQDRSPVRRVGTKNIVRNVTYAALTLAEESLKQDDADAAKRWLTLAESIDNGSMLGPVYRDRIAQLTEQLDH